MKIHGLYQTITYNSWENMLKRCYCKSAINYKQYGGSGILVCEYLRSSVVNLIMLIGERPSPKHSIDRIDSNFSYTCGVCSECLSNSWFINVRWATRREQTMNRSIARTLTILGQTKHLQDWADESGLKYCTIYSRIIRGHSGPELLNPPRNRRC